MKLTRRGLAKGLVTSGVALTGLPNLLDAQIRVTSSREHTTPWLPVHPGVWRATIGKPEAITPVSTRLVPSQTEGFAQLPRVREIPLPELAGEITPRGCTVSLPLRQDERLYGLDLQFLSFEQRGKKKVVRVNADPKMDTGDSHAPVPFYVTTEGIGILVDTARYAVFYLGDARPKPTHALHNVTTNSPDPNYTHNLKDSDTGRITIEVPRTSGVDVYLFAGPSMLDAVRRYNVFSGGGPVPPEWGLGFWYRADARATQQYVLNLAQEFRDSKIPCDVIGLEPGWQSHAYSCTFVWDTNRFPDPKAFVRSAQGLHYRVNLWEHAFTHPASPLFPPLESYSGDYGV